MKLSTADKLRLRNLWKGESTDEEICEILGLTPEQLAEVAAAMRLPERVIPEIYTPTREEILLACAKIRSEWTQEQREARLRASWRVIISDSEADDAGDCNT